MKKSTILKGAILAGAAVHAGVVASFKPRPRDLLDPGWHLELPIRVMGRGLAWLLPAVYRKYGERGVKRLQYVFYMAGLERARLIHEKLGIDKDDARSLGRVLDFEDGMVGVRGVWTEETRGRATKEERYCPMTRELEKCPEVCTKLMVAMEAGTFKIINPDITVPELTELLSTGDPCCRATFQLDYLDPETAAQESPHATHGAFPPVLKVPGLRFRMAAAAMRGNLKAILTLLTKDIDDIDMHWYEHMRYQPV
jgi:hypothetical protein